MLLIKFDLIAVYFVSYCMCVIACVSKQICGVLKVKKIPFDLYKNVWVMWFWLCFFGYFSECKKQDKKEEKVNKWFIICFSMATFLVRCVCGKIEIFSYWKAFLVYFLYYYWKYRPTQGNLLLVRVITATRKTVWETKQWKRFLLNINKWSASQQSDSVYFTIFVIRECGILATIISDCYCKRGNAISSTWFPIFCLIYFRFT